MVSLIYLNACRKENKMSETCSTNNRFILKFAVLFWMAFLYYHIFQKAWLNLYIHRFLQPGLGFFWWFWDQVLAGWYWQKLEDSHVNGVFWSKGKQIFPGSSEFISINIDSISLRAKNSLSFASTFSKIESWPSTLHQLVLQDDSY